jgi:hypothetical protein
MTIAPDDIAILAASDFRPRTKEPGDKDIVPSNEDAAPILCELRMALACMFKTKEELVEVVRGLSEEASPSEPDIDLLRAMMLGIDHAKVFAESMTELCVAANARLLAATAVLALEESGAVASENADPAEDRCSQSRLERLR